MNTNVQSIREQIESAIANKKVEISELQSALNILTDRGVESVEIKRPRGRRAARSDTFIVKTVKRGPGRPKGSTTRTPADVVAD